MNRYIIIIAALFGAIGVMLGAFGAHAFEDELLAAGRTDTFETAVKYHFYHTLAALIAVLLATDSVQHRKARTASVLFLTGVFLFSGSLYVLCFTSQTWIAFVTPVGGLFFIAGWIWLSYAAYRAQFKLDGD
ncbi:MAG: DUF423 domain-containing protein [Candidatus Cyclobacteriaceae bacterium M2_1C_046]